MRSTAPAGPPAPTAPLPPDRNQRATAVLPPGMLARRPRWALWTVLPGHWRWAPWAALPLLAWLAYVPVLAVGFVSDDWVLLSQGRLWGQNPRLLLPNPQAFFYRPVGDVLIWVIGGYLWSANPWPYHAVGLALHAAVALLLGLWLTQVSGRARLGWAGGALFAVFPLHIEATAWVAAQYDLWATLFGLGSLTLFTVWWRRAGPAWLYPLAVGTFVLAIFSKESVLALPLLFAASAWLTTPVWDRALRRRLGRALLPFALVLVGAAALRWLVWGKLGNYPFARTDYGNFVWDGLLANARLLLAPINPDLLGQAPLQIAGALMSSAVLVGLVRYGRQAWRMLLVAALWLLAALAPVLNNPVGPGDLVQNRYLYLPAAGYCTALAALAYPALVRAGRWGALARALLAALILLSAGLAEVQVQPYQAATRLASAVDSRLQRLILPQATARPQGLVLFVQNPPASYKGAFVLLLGLGLTPSFLGDPASAVPVAVAAKAPLAGESRDAFALRFGPTGRAGRFDLDSVAGITANGVPPRPDQAGARLTTWDFRTCAPAPLAAWTVLGQPPGCTAGAGLQLPMAGTTLDGPALALHPPAEHARFVRLRIAIRYPAGAARSGRNTWAWHGPADTWNPRHSLSLPVKEDGASHVYWTFVPADAAGDTLSRLRFTPPAAADAAVITWIAIDEVR